MSFAPRSKVKLLKITYFKISLKISSSPSQWQTKGYRAHSHRRGSLTSFHQFTCRSLPLTKNLPPPCMQKICSQAINFLTPLCWLDGRSSLTSQGLESIAPSKIVDFDYTKNFLAISNSLATRHNSNYMDIFYIENFTGL